MNFPLVNTLYLAIFKRMICCKFDITLSWSIEFYKQQVHSILSSLVLYQLFPGIITEQLVCTYSTTCTLTFCFGSAPQNNKLQKIMLNSSLNITDQLYLSQLCIGAQLVLQQSQKNDQKQNKFQSRHFHLHSVTWLTQHIRSLIKC